MRRIFQMCILIIVFAGIGLYFYDPYLFEKVEEYVFNEEIYAFTPRYQAQDLLKAHKKILLRKGSDTFLPPKLYYMPSVLVDLKKKQKNGKVIESTQLWSLTDGERILNLADWKTTKGYGLIIDLDASHDEIALLDEMSTYKVANVDDLHQKLSVNKYQLEKVLKKTEEKGLTKKKGKTIYLLKNPFVLSLEDAPLNLPALTHSSHYAGYFQKRFSKWQIATLIHKASESDTIECMREVNIPIWQIPVVRDNGKKVVSYWNALNGQLVATIEE